MGEWRSGLVSLMLNNAGNNVTAIYKQFFCHGVLLGRAVDAAGTTLTCECLVRMGHQKGFVSNRFTLNP